MDPDKEARDIDNAEPEIPIGELTTKIVAAEK